MWSESKRDRWGDRRRDATNNRLGQSSRRENEAYMMFIAICSLGKRSPMKGIDNNESAYARTKDSLASLEFSPLVMSSNSFKPCMGLESISLAYI
jgi:hypothetical protein